MTLIPDDQTPEIQQQSRVGAQSARKRGALFGG